MVDARINLEEDYMQKDYPKIEDKEFDPIDQEKRDDNMYKYHDNTQMFDPKT